MDERRNLLQQTLNLYQSQIYSLNHLYNLHYNIMQNLNTNVTNVINSQYDIFSDRTQFSNSMPPPFPIYPNSGVFNPHPPTTTTGRTFSPLPQPPPPPPGPIGPITNSGITNIPRVRRSSFYRNRRRHNTNTFRNNNISARNRRRPFNFSPLIPWQTNQTDLHRTLNNSLYDSNNRRSLPRDIFESSTTTDSWHNIRILLDLSNNTRCPITQEIFLPTNNVSRIHYCGHIFNTNSILEWFTHDTRCPVCRYNLLEETANDHSGNNISSNNFLNNNFLNNNFLSNITQTANNDISLNNMQNIITNMFDPSYSMVDLSENIFNISNDIASTIVNAFQTFVRNDQDVSSNLFTGMTFDFSNSTDTNAENFNHNPFYNGNNLHTNQTILEPASLYGSLVDSDRLETIVDNILNHEIFANNTTNSTNNNEGKVGRKY